MKRRARYYHNGVNRYLKIAAAVAVTAVIIALAGRSGGILKNFNPFNLVRPILKSTGVMYSYDTEEREENNILSFVEGNISTVSVKSTQNAGIRVYGSKTSWYMNSLNARGMSISAGINENRDTGEKETNESITEDNGEKIIEKNVENTENESSENQKNTEAEGAEAVNTISKKVYVNMPESIGTTYTLEQLSNSNFTINKFFTVPSSTKLLASDVDIITVMGYDMTMKKNNGKPQILIYHTHSMEGYSDSVKGDVSTGVVGIGDYLTKILEEQFGYNVIHCSDSFDVDENGNTDRTKAYTRARAGIEKILEENPTIEVVLDIHRDGVDDSLHFVTTVNGKKTAKIMFFNGLCRNSKGNEIDYGTTQYRSENLAMSLQMKLLAEEFYPEFTRKNYVNAFHYNMNLREKSMLIEVGAQTNTFEEAKNAMEPLAVLLNKLLN